MAALSYGLSDCVGGILSKSRERIPTRELLTVP